MKQIMNVTAKLMLSLCVISLVACSDQETVVRSDATLQGKLTYKGKPLPHALVIVTAAQGISAQGKADADGNYVVEHAPVGEVQVGVNTDAGRGMMMGEIMAAAQSADKSKKPPELIDIPKKFFEPTKSGLSTTVADGKTATTYDIDIK